MKVDLKIIEELERYRKINNYITEQEATLPPPPVPEPGAEALPPPPPPTGEVGAAAPPPAPAAEGEPVGDVGEKVDTSTDPEVEKIGDKKEKGKEIEVTDLVKSQRNVEKKQEEYFENLFKHLDDLENKLSTMDSIMNKLNDLETKVEKYRVKSPEEKLELRSLDSGPYNQKLSDFFTDKQDDLEKSGKNEYILTQQEVENYSPNEVKRSFRVFGDDEPEFTNFKRVQ